jgi:hypothetical protein
MLVPLSCCLSATGIRVLGILSHQGIQPSLRSAYRPAHPTWGTTRTLTGRVEPRRGTGISTGPFPWPALRTRRAHY